jgi:hypothetical protein
MKTIHTQSCPLCGNGAEYQFVDYDNRKHFRCRTCTEFQISVRAEQRLAESIPQWRADYSAKARQALEGFTLVITIPNTPKQEGVANPALIGEFVSNSELPR